MNDIGPIEQVIGGNAIAALVVVVVVCVAFAAALTLDL